MATGIDPLHGNGRTMMNRLKLLCLLGLILLAGCDPDKIASADLADLTLSAGKLEPEFSSSVLSYTATVGDDVSVITVTVTTADSDALVLINSVEVSSTNGSTQVALARGSNTITVYVINSTPDYEFNSKTYEVIVTRLEASFSIGGSVSGLDGTLTLQNNGADDLVLDADGSFSFALPVAEGDDYDVTVSVQPETQTCSVSNGLGVVIGAEIDNIIVECVNN